MSTSRRIRELTEQLEAVYDGQPWYGPSWEESLRKISPEWALRKPAHGPSIAGMLLHVVAWRTYATRKLQGQEDYELDPGQDWLEVGEETEWESVVRTFAASQRDLMEAIHEFPATMIDAAVPGRGYSWFFLLQGLVQHDIYHMAQINLLARQWHREAG